MQVYDGDFDNKEDIVSNFQLSKGSLDDCEIIYASYGSASYEGDAFVIFKQGNKYFEAVGSHCSCYGLEGQWDPEEFEKEVFRERVKRKGSHSYYGHDFAKALRNLEAS